MRISDWSSDVCSSDLVTPAQGGPVTLREGRVNGVGSASRIANRCSGDRKSVVLGKRVSVRVDRGGRRILNKKTQTHKVTNLPKHQTNRLVGTTILICKYGSYVILS